MKRSQITPLPNYFDRYILKCDDVDLLQALDISNQELLQLPLEKLEALKDQVYAADKWTVKDILQHLIDTERVFSFRAMTIARGEPNTQSFDEVIYGKNALANRRTVKELFEEAIALRKTTIHLFHSFSEAMLSLIGEGTVSEYTVGSIGFILAGHQRWHWQILEERYYPLLLS